MLFRSPVFSTLRTIPSINWSVLPRSSLNVIKVSRVPTIKEGTSNLNISDGAKKWRDEFHHFLHKISCMCSNTGRLQVPTIQSKIKIDKWADILAIGLMFMNKRYKHTPLQHPHWSSHKQMTRQRRDASSILPA